MKKVLSKMNLQELEEFCLSIGQSKFRAKQIYNWIYLKSVHNIDDMTDLSKKFRDELIESIRTETNKFFEISIIGLGIDIGLPMVYDTKRKAADMNIESLTEADYSLQQINQILKANDEGIILSAINPIVPERVFRKIREKYKTNKEKMDQFIEQLSIKTKTQEDIDKICEEIISL